MQFFLVVHFGWVVHLFSGSGSLCSAVICANFRCESIA